MGSKFNLLREAKQPYIRMSSAGNCRLQIAHYMIGTEEHNRRGNDLGMRMGTHLEPMIVEFLADNGFLVTFTGNEQLEIAAQDPGRVGHNDGLVWLDPLEEPSHWIRFNVPEDITRLLQRVVMNLEIKTMNEETFGRFQREGLKGGTFTAKYLGQANQYEGAMLNAENDELWAGPVLEYKGDDILPSNSKDYREFLRTNMFDRPEYTLFVCYTPGLKPFGFELHKHDPEAYEQRSAELEAGLIVPLLQGNLPAPDEDGRAGSCYFCPFAYECPAVQETIASRTLDQIPTTVIEDEEAIEEFTHEYWEITQQIKELETAKKTLRKKFDEKFEAGVFVTPNFIIELSPVKGRRSMDKRAIGELVGGEENIPHKTGKASTRLSVKPRYGVTLDGETI